MVKYKGTLIITFIGKYIIKIRYLLSLSSTSLCPWYAETSILVPKNDLS